MLIRWAFDECGLELVTASVSGSNLASANVLIKNGLVQCGKYSLARFEKGHRYDEYHFEILKETFYTKDNEKSNS